jgi:hypothetical protein
MKQHSKPLFSIIVFVFGCATYGFSQKVTTPVVNSVDLKPKSEVKAVEVEQSNSDPVPVQNTEAPVFISISNPVTFSTNTEVQEELTKEQRIEKLKMEIESIEAKLFYLNEDPATNAVEINEKQVALDAKKKELETLDNN